MTKVANPFRFATVTDDGVLWRLKRNCALTPRQVGGFYAMLCALSLAVGVFFWSQGARVVLFFIALELGAVGLAFVWYARHATDGECIRLEPRFLVVERETAGQLERTAFEREWVRVEAAPHSRDLIEVAAGANKVCVGRFMRAEWRPALAREIRQALRGA